MSRGIANMPGVGGSLGMCALCGKPFLSEILLGRKVHLIAVTGFDLDLCFHGACVKVLRKCRKDWHTLPDGPLRQAYERAERTPPAEDAVALAPQSA